ncbi:hypothetical protein PUN4_340190 [Paraburkholderia unamae]|uniref:hypothetical protein n=1 Tax=Paraburkholderia unamae TaxID=219649 RepID=UPI001CB125E7|nr:hypothetical protein PUN4_340190 [Paraburkholderia unamae]
MTDSAIEAGHEHNEALMIWTTNNMIHGIAAAHWPQYKQPDAFHTVMHAFLSTGKT